MFRHGNNRYDIGQQSAYSMTPFNQQNSDSPPPMYQQHPNSSKNKKSAFSFVNYSFSGDNADQHLKPAADLPESRSAVSFTTSPTVNTEITWTDLSVYVQVKNGPKQILKSISGSVNNLKMMCILGPSGAGKSTLLNTIAGINKNFQGEIDIKSRQKNIAFAYVPQTDELAAFLTVREALTFASKLKNPAKTDHRREVNKVMEKFGLQKCADHLASKCSGGERKRLSIGCEMVSKPNVLVLDEPTSGLDSTTSLKVMETVKYSHSDTVILTTIHQPNSTLFQLFDLAYILTNGQCLYFGPPKGMVRHLQSMEIQVPTYTNPADFILDVANDDKTPAGQKTIAKLTQHCYVVDGMDPEEIEEEQLSSDIPAIEKAADQQQQESSDIEPVSLANGANNNNGNGTKQPTTTPQIVVAGDQRVINMGDHPPKSCICGALSKVSPFVENMPQGYDYNEMRSISRAHMRQIASFWRTYPLLVKKLFMYAARDPQQSLFRLFNNLLLPLILRALATGAHGKETGCSFIYENSTHVLNENIYERFDRQEIGTQNAGLTFLDLMFAFFSTLVPGILSISQHINVLKKEYINSYYSITAFYMALITVTSLLTVFFSTVNALAYFFMTGQTYTDEKLFYFWLIVLLTSLLGDFFGLFLSTLFPRSNLTALVIGGFLGFGLHTFCGFFVPTDQMRDWFRAITYFVFCRHTFEAMIKTLYGHGQCRISEQGIFNFDQLLDFVDYYNHETHENLEIIEKMPVKVRTALEQNEWKKKAMFDLAEANNDLDEAGLARLDHFWNFKTSYIIDSYAIDSQSGFSENFLIIGGTLLLMVTLCYTILLMKLRK